jgi:uncharacterized protein (UPF0332 family)
MMDEATRSAIVSYRMENALNTLKEIPIHTEHKLWNTAVNRLYYACFYAVTALLVKHKIETQTHAGARRMLSLHFTKAGKLPVKLNKFYTDLFENRQTGDYEDFIYFDKETVDELYIQAVEFIEAIEHLVIEAPDIDNTQSTK